MKKQKKTWRARPSLKYNDALKELYTPAPDITTKSKQIRRTDIKSRGKV